MNPLRDRAKEHFPTVLLTLLSIVQALSLELWWQYLSEVRPAIRDGACVPDALGADHHNHCRYSDRLSFLCRNCDAFSLSSRYFRLVVPVFCWNYPVFVD